MGQWRSLAESNVERLPGTPWWRAIAREAAGGWGASALTDRHRPLADPDTGAATDPRAGAARGEPGTDAGRRAPEVARTP